MSWMRWLFATLLMFNVLAAYWFSSSAEHRLDQASNPKTPLHAKSPDIATLELLSKEQLYKLRQEARKEERSKPIAEIGEGIIAATEVLAEDKSCQILGPFSSESSIDQFQIVLSEHGVESNPLQREEVVREDFWLIIPPGKTREQTGQLLNELKQKKIESFVIDSGEYKNAISLGVFVEQKNTDNYKNELAELGVETTVVLRPHFEQRAWLAIAEGVENIRTADWIEDLLAEKGGNFRLLEGQPCVSRD